MQVLEKLGREVCLPALLPCAEAKRLAADAGTRVNDVGSSKSVFRPVESFGRTFEARKEWKEIQYNGTRATKILAPPRPKLGLAGCQYFCPPREWMGVEAQIYVPRLCNHERCSDRLGQACNSLL